MLRILLAENYAPMREVLRVLPEHLGRSDLDGPDGRAASEASRAERFNLIVPNIRMPVMDGFRAAVGDQCRSKPRTQSKRRNQPCIDQRMKYPG
jgi:CheY-like chemotaxis protein